MNPVVKLFKELAYKGLERFGLYYSIYRAFVYDNEDPDGMQRLQLVIPGISDNPSEIWAWGRGQFVGENYGMQILPQKGDMVWVSFDQGNPNFPVWEHGHCGENEIPKELRNPNIFWFRTPKGFLVEIDDDKEEIRVQDIFSNSIYLNKNGISLAAKGKGKVFLGDINKAAQSGVLGENLEKILGTLSGGILGAMKNLTNTNKELVSLVTKMSAAPTPAALLTVVTSNAVGFNKSLKDSETEMSKSNESISALNKTIPGIKSSKVRIDE